MDLMNDYFVEHLVKALLAELRADGARMQGLALQTVGAASPTRSFGARLIDWARWLVNAPRPRAPLPPPRERGRPREAW